MEGETAMQMKDRPLDTSCTFDQFPSLPNLLLKLIQTCNQEDVELKAVSEIIEKDPALTGKILKMVNSSMFSLPRTITNIDQATTLVGLNAVKSIAISASIHKAFGQLTGNGTFNLKMFWFHSLHCGTLARLIAKTNRNCDPDQAFLSGLLHDIGRLVLWVQHPKQYARLLSGNTQDPRHILEDEADFGGPHTEIGACLLEHWKLDSFIADCARYHHEPLERIQNAFPLVQTIYLADCLSSGKIVPCTESRKDLESIFGMTSKDMELCLLEARVELEKVADYLDIPIEEPPEAESQVCSRHDQQVQEQLNLEVRDISLLLGSLQDLAKANDTDAIHAIAAQGVKILFDLDFFYFFLYDSHKKGLVLHRKSDEDHAGWPDDVFIPIPAKNTLLNACMNSGKPLDTFTSPQPVSILEEQLIRLSGQEGLLCIPIKVQKNPIGLIVFGISQTWHQIRQNKNLLQMFSNQVGLALNAVLSNEARIKAVQTQRNEASSTLARKIIHEVNSPLTIIKNYLKILGMNLEEQSVHQDEIPIINDEIDRIAELIQQLHPFAEAVALDTTTVEPNTILEDLVKLLKDSYLREKNIRIHLDLSPSNPKVEADKNSLKQVFINLIKNAAESMTAGGTLTIQTKSILPKLMGQTVCESQDFQGYVEITFTDDGPGISQEMLEHIFDPYQTTKGTGHSGIGLSLSYEIIKQFNGQITCTSEPWKKTTFTIDLPLTDS